MTARFATPEEISTWNTLVARSTPHDTIFSTMEYGTIKLDTRYSPRYIIVDTLAILVLEKRTPLLGRFWYLPKGPNVASAGEFHAVLGAIKNLARKAGVFFVRAESEIPLTESSELASYGYRKATAIIPSQSTITLTISADIDDLITTLPQKGRYAIRRAERDGVTVARVDATEENCRTMYALLSDTAKGQFGIRSYEYYKQYWQTFSSSHMGQLFFAYYDTRVVAGAYALYFNKKSTYKDGASIRERTAYGASHLLQWHVIQWAKENGSITHDLCGSPPSNRIHDTTHPHHNIGLFKTSFNKEVTDYIGCYDMVVSPLRYAIWNAIAERVYKKLYFQKTHDYYY